MSANYGSFTPRFLGRNNYRMRAVIHASSRGYGGVASVKEFEITVPILDIRQSMTNTDRETGRYQTPEVEVEIHLAEEEWAFLADSYVRVHGLYGLREMEGLCFNDQGYDTHAADYERMNVRTEVVFAMGGSDHRMTMTGKGDLNGSTYDLVLPASEADAKAVAEFYIANGGVIDYEPDVSQPRERRLIRQDNPARRR